METTGQEKGNSSPLHFLTSNVIYAKAAEAILAFQRKRLELDLPNPGTIDNLSKEVERDVFLNNYSFTGLRADISRQLSVANPLFQVSHQFSMGSQMQPPYTFALLYGSPKVFMQANLDSDRSLLARCNWRWNSALVTKTTTQIAPGQGAAVLVVENDVTGSDFSASIKANNPSILEGGLTGTISGDYLQSITPRLSLGLNAVWQREAMNKGPDMMLTYGARYKGDDWIGSARFLSLAGLIQLSYWRRIAEKVEAGVNLELSFLRGAGPGAAMMGMPSGPEGQATIGAKYDFRAASVRAQVDSNGRIACMLEKRVAPPVQVTFVGQIDHVKNEAKVGLSVSIESMSEDVMEQQERLAQSGEEIPNPPF